jgi:hypothetical protein
MNTPNAPVSWGELIDKITILEIKTRHLSNPAALANVSHELQLLSKIAEPAMTTSGIAELKAKLTQINQTLWTIEDDIRDKEAAKSFDDRFIELARSVYRTNDERALVKRQINAALSSELVEEKSYKAY